MFLTFDQIVDEIYQGMSKTDLDAVRDVMDAEGMIVFHGSTGMGIRNKYNLWDPANPLTSQYFEDYKNGVQHIVDGVDCHPQHPDVVCHEILKAVWTKVKLRDLKNSAIERMCK